MALTVTSCRESSDTLLSYDHDDYLSFGEGQSSFGGKYKIAWKALNQYYCLWDYEMQHGLDWDAAYDTYYPQFAALDKRTEDNPVTDKELKALMDEAFGGLHDGHLTIGFSNHITGTKSVVVSPSTNRNLDREDFDISNKYKPNISKYYTLPANGEIELDEQGQPQTAFYSTEISFLMDMFMNTKGMGYMWICDQIDKISELTLPTAEQIEKLNALKELKAKLSDEDLSYTDYNELAIRYAYLNVPGFDMINSGFEEEGLTVRYALLKGNIPYLHFSQFSLSTYIPDNGASALNQNDPNLDKHIEGIRNVWEAWFDAIQELGKAGKLGGVIIDLRGNVGGSTGDFPYTLGALRPSGGMIVGKERFKRGTGRLDYSIPMPAVMDTYYGEHYVVDDEPIVLLTNCGSISMSEITSLGAKTLKNAKLIGKRTSGGICGLTGNEKNTLNYSGQVGEAGKTPVSCYCPTLALLTVDDKILEGVGVTPDIEVNFDVMQYETTGKDSQLDRALQYIRNGQ